MNATIQNELATRYLTQIVVDVLNEVGSGPSSMLYLAMKEHGVSLEKFNDIINKLASDRIIGTDKHWLTLNKEEAKRHKYIQ